MGCDGSVEMRRTTPATENRLAESRRHCMLGSVPEEPSRSGYPLPAVPVPFPGIVQSVVLIGVYMGAFHIGTIAFLVAQASALRVIFPWRELVCTLAAFGVVIAVAPLVTRTRLGSVLPNRLASREVLCCAALLAVGAGVAWWCVVGLAGTVRTDYMADVVRSLRIRVRNPLLAILIVPVVEGILCRGLLLPAVSKRHGTVGAILWSATAFALLPMNQWTLASRFLQGLLLGWIRSRTGVLGACIVTHAVMAVFLVFTGDAVMQSNSANPLPVKFEFLGLAVLMASIDWMRRLTAAPAPE